MTSLEWAMVTVWNGSLVLVMPSQSINYSVQAHPGSNREKGS